MLIEYNFENMLIFKKSHRNYNLVTKNYATQNSLNNINTFLNNKC